MNVNIYMDSANHPKFNKMLQDFAVGTIRAGEKVARVSGSYQPADVHVIFGSWKDRNILHHNIKREIVEKASNFICIETPLVGRREVQNVGDDVWYRVGMNGFLADTGNFNNKNRPGDRWIKVKEELNVSLDSYRLGDSILVALQIPGDASLRGTVIEDWAYETCHKIRAHTDRPILIRTPQIIKEFNLNKLNKIKEEVPNINFSVGTKENLIPSIKSSWATVTYSSGLGIDSYLAGVPSFTLDKASFGYSLGNTDIANIENPKLSDREPWINDLCYAQWNEYEMQEGIVWNHMKELL